ncbi:hypothetical protein SAMN05428977_104723 [Nitrosomonas sp. Nm166]|nr:hypothetical protein SAMN05428977_104723 [Nitrosomonas sp. Nm166]
MIWEIFGIISSFLKRHRDLKLLLILNVYNVAEPEAFHNFPNKDSVSSGKIEK